MFSFLFLAIFSNKKENMSSVFLSIYRKVVKVSENSAEAVETFTRGLCTSVISILPNVHSYFSYSILQSPEDFSQVIASLPRRLS